MRRIDGILFDLGDTLLDFGEVDTGEIFLDGAKRTYQQLSDWSQPLPTFAEYHRRLLRAVHWSYFKSLVTGREFNSLDVLRRHCQRMGQSLPESDYEELVWQWYLPLAERADLTPHLPELLADLQSDGLTLGVISNNFIPRCVLDRHLAEVDLLSVLPVRVYSCEYGRRKPGRGIFRHALELTGLSAERTMFVGDKIRPDIFGSNRMGMTSVLKDPLGRHKRKKRADYVITSLLELPDIVRSLNASDREPCEIQGAFK